MPSCMASPSSTSMVSLRLTAGRNSRPPPLTILLDLRWPDDLQLYPNQPISRLSAPLPSSLSGWMAREGHPGSHALRSRLWAGSGRLLSAPRRSGCPVSGVEVLSGSEARVLAWRYLGPHARARHPAARPLLPGGSRPHSPGPPQPADQVCAAAFWPKRICSLYRRHRTIGLPRLLAGMEDDFGPLSDGTGWIVSLRSPAGLLLLDQRDFGSRPGSFCAQAVSRNSIPAHHHHG